MAITIKTAAYNNLGQSFSQGKLSAELPLLRKAYPFMKEVNSQALQSVLLNVEEAFSRMFKGLGGYPNYKKKNGKQSFQCPQNASVANNKLSLPKFRDGIKLELHRPFRGEIKTVTISRVPSGKYFASILVDNKTALSKELLVTEDKCIGIDPGINSLFTLSDGTKIHNPKWLRKAEEKLARLQQELAKKKKGSNRYKELRQRIAKLHEKIANQRKDLLHKESTKIANGYDTACFEDLNIKGMSARAKPKPDPDKPGQLLHNHAAQKSGLNKSITDAGWGMFINMVSYKLAWKGGHAIKMKRFDASSKETYCCGARIEGLTLADREVICPVCNQTWDRDINAAQVIKKKALKLWRTEHAHLDEENTLVKKKISSRQKFVRKKSTLVENTPAKLCA